MMYRLNLYSGGKLASTELVETSLADAKELAIAGLSEGKAHRVELLNANGAVIFQRWAVL